MAEHTIHANGIDIHYLDQGDGPPLVLLHGGVVSTNPIWAAAPIAYAAHMPALTSRFRVIAPDTRGCARTGHTGGPISFSLLADDVVALIEALGVQRPLVAGFSEGAVTATIVGIRAPKSVRAIVNDAGYDLFNPAAKSFGMMRQMLGGSSEATAADPEALERFLSRSEPMRAMFQLMRADQDAAQGAGAWRRYVERAFPRTTEWPGYTVEDFRRIVVPTLILAGDRDDFCSCEEAVAAYRMLPAGEMAILPNTGHVITPGAIDQTIEFLARQA